MRERMLCIKMRYFPRDATAKQHTRDQEVIFTAWYTSLHPGRKWKAFNFLYSKTRHKSSQLQKGHLTASLMACTLVLWAAIQFRENKLKCGAVHLALFKGTVLIRTVMSHKSCHKTSVRTKKITSTTKHTHKDRQTKAKHSTGTQLEWLSYI